MLKTQIPLLGRTVPLKEGIGTSSTDGSGGYSDIRPITSHRKTHTLVGKHTKPRVLC